MRVLGENAGGGLRCYIVTSSPDFWAKQRWPAPRVLIDSRRRPPALKPVLFYRTGRLVCRCSNVSAACSVGNMASDKSVKVRQLQRTVRVADHESEQVLASRPIRRTTTAAIEAGVQRVLEAAEAVFLFGSP